MVVEKYQWKDPALQISKVGRFTQCLGTMLKYLKYKSITLAILGKQQQRKQQLCLIWASLVEEN